jgi:hypothetical protein
MSRIINLTEGMRFGVGIDEQTEEARGSPIEYDGISDAEGGQIVHAEIRMIESQESLMESLNLSVSASVRYGTFSGDAKFSLAQSHSVNRYSLYLLLTADVRNPARHMVRPRLSDEAMRIYRNDPETFRAIYGDAYIDEIYSGGDFYGLFVFESIDEHSLTDIKASLHASIGTFVAGGELDASFKIAVEEAKKKSSMQIKVLVSGGAGLENPTDLEGLKALYANFNQKVLERPIDYKASVKEFRYLPLPEGPTWAESAVRRDTIEQCGRRVLDGIRLRSDLDFILRYPGQFVQPDLDALRAAYQEVDAQLPKLAARARECAQNLDHCSLDGMTPVTIALPERIASAEDPLQAKLEDIQRHDSRAAAFIAKERLKTPIVDYDRGPRGGRFKLFHGEDGNPVGGLFWHPDLGAFAVYGAIFQEYMRRDNCSGSLGYPVSDEEAFTGQQVDGMGRISHFEHGQLWWDAQSGAVHEALPRTFVGAAVSTAFDTSLATRPILRGR